VCPNIYILATKLYLRVHDGGRQLVRRITVFFATIRRPHDSRYARREPHALLAVAVMVVRTGRDA
jgi:hypothetical protein